MTKIGINGFGRIGRLVFRGLLDRDDLEVVAINNPSGVETAEYLLKYDTVHGRLGKDVKIDGDDLIIDGKRVHVFSDRDPEHLDWSKYGVEIVVESTGKLKDKESAGKHIKGTVKKVIITAPGKDDDATIVMGVNEDTYNPETDNIISNASCTTNCLAPVVKVLNEKFHIVRGLMTTVHSYTNDQAIKAAAEGELKGILAYTDEPLVSSDFKTTDVSSTVDSLLTMVMEGNLVKVIAWYDNEWGYSMRIIDLVKFVASKGL